MLAHRLRASVRASRIANCAVGGHDLPVHQRDADGPFAVGGTPDGEVRAQADAWPRIVRFLTDAAARAR